MDVFQLVFLEIGNHPLTLPVHDGEQRRSRLDELPLIDVAFTQFSFGDGIDPAVGKFQLLLIDTCLFNVGLRLCLANQRPHNLQAGFGNPYVQLAGVQLFVGDIGSRLAVVKLSLGNGISFKKPLVAVQVVVCLGLAKPDHLQVPFGIDQRGLRIG